MKPKFVMIVFILILLLAFSSIFGQVPQYMNYQGRLTDDEGAPITNTSPGVQMTFTIWDDETLSDPSNEEWTSGPVYVPVENGLFNYQIGPFSGALLLDIFTSTDHWLGVQVEGDPEINPRSKLASVLYAVHAATVQDVYVNEVGDNISGDLIFDGQNNGEIDGKIFVDDYHTDLELYESEILTAKLWGWEYGELDMYYFSDGLMRAALVGGYDGGMMTLLDNADHDKIVLDARTTGDMSVFLPEDAVNAGEMLNEPGICGTLSTGTTTLTTDMADMQTIYIDIPSSGYIHVEGWCYVDFYNVSGPEYAYVQIDETAGGTYTPGYCNIAGMGSFPNTSHFDYPIYVNRIYYKGAAGTYQFRMEAKIGYNNGTVTCKTPNLAAIYYPTSYAAIKAITDDPGDYPEPTIVTAVDPITDSERDVYEVDLRYYELKVKEAELKTQQAKLELKQAELRAARQKESAGENK